MLFLTTVSAQISFQKTYGSNGFEKVSKVIQSYDNGYVVVGSSGLTGASSDVYVLKVDSLGNYLWSKYYGGSNVDHGTDIVETVDSGFAISGYTNSTGYGGYDAYLIKIDKDGNFEWETTYGGSDWDFAHAIDVMPDSGYVIVGETYSMGEGNNDVYAIRTDKFGSIMWETTIGTAGHDLANDFTLTTFNSVILTGSTDGRGNGGKDIFAARINTLGDTIWTRTFGDNLDDVGNGIKTITQFNFYNIAATVESGTNGTTNPRLLGLNGNGDTVYTREYDLPVIMAGNDLAQSMPGEQMMVGVVDDPLTGLNYFGYLMSYQGTFISSHVFGTVGVDECKSVIYTYDKGFLLAGTSEGYSVGGTDIYLVKIGPGPDYIGSPSLDDQFQDFTPVNELPKLTSKIHPNPASDYIVIESEEFNLNLNIYDLSGKIILSDQINPGKYDLPNISSGMYLIELISESGIKSIEKVRIENY